MDMLKKGMDWMMDHKIVMLGVLAGGGALLYMYAC
jgi:hypothetical protein